MSSIGLVYYVLINVRLFLCDSGLSAFQLVHEMTLDPFYRLPAERPTLEGDAAHTGPGGATGGSGELVFSVNLFVLSDFGHMFQPLQL